MGGKILQLDGAGFTSSTQILLRSTNDSNYSCLGPRQAVCEVIKLTGVQIQCHLKSLSRVYKITNNGTHQSKRQFHVIWSAVLLLRIHLGNT